MIISKLMLIWQQEYVAVFHHLYLKFKKAAGFAIGVVGDAGVRANA
jgi:hypothetical protein